jgi:Raf kinase inhibitor-like YbhB/YbcL family protein
MKLTSSAFAHNADIPRKHTCQGGDVSPELTIADIPDGTRSLALIVEDPDAPGRTFDHWVLYDIPAATAAIGEGATPGTAGRNDFGRNAYGGPCPPSGKHRYFFKLYALDTRLDWPEGRSKGDLQKAMAEHVLDQAELVGLYAKG